MSQFFNQYFNFDVMREHFGEVLVGFLQNLLVFAGVLFSGRLDESGALGDALITFIAFCGISSAGYLFLRAARATSPSASGLSRG